MPAGHSSGRSRTSPRAQRRAERRKRLRRTIILGSAALAAVSATALQNDSSCPVARCGSRQYTANSKRIFDSWANVVRVSGARVD